MKEKEEYKKNYNYRIERIKKEYEDHKSKEKEDKTLQMIKNYYLGKKDDKKKKIVRPTEKFSRVFKFEWDESEDTSEDLNPLITKKAEIHLAFGRGYEAGTDQRYQRQKNTYIEELLKLRHKYEKTNISEEDRLVIKNQEKEIEEKIKEQNKKIEIEDKPWQEKKLEQMNSRDWRIFREDYDIQIEGGRAPNPIRYWEESSIHPLILKAIKDLGYKEPTAIQRQSIPIGLAKKDIIGVAETGSGKTAAYVIPLLTYYILIF